MRSRGIVAADKSSDGHRVLKRPQFVSKRANADWAIAKPLHGSVQRGQTRGPRPSDFKPPISDFVGRQFCKPMVEPYLVFGVPIVTIAIGEPFGGQLLNFSCAFQRVSVTSPFAALADRREIDLRAAHPVAQMLGTVSSVTPHFSATARRDDPSTRRNMTTSRQRGGSSSEGRLEPTKLISRNHAAIWTGLVLGNIECLQIRHGIHRDNILPHNRSMIRLRATVRTNGQAGFGISQHAAS